VEASVLIACWSTKGGVGTSVVAAGLAVLLARRAEAGAVLADLAGDAPAVLGVPEPRSPGLTAWLAAGDHAPVDALSRLEVAAGPGLGLVPRGDGQLTAERIPVLAAVLDGGLRPAVVDCGRVGPPAVAALARRATHSLLVMRPCYMALRAVKRAPIRASGVVVVAEPGRALSPDDIGDAAGAPVVATVPLDPQVARRVDAGLLNGRLPRALDALGAVA
jgi:Mrp family chromosome partitioning ATPase